MPEEQHLDDFVAAEQLSDSAIVYTLPVERFRLAEKIATEFLDRYSDGYELSHQLVSALGNPRRSTITADNGSAAAHLHIEYNMYGDASVMVMRAYLKAHSRGRLLKDFETASNTYTVGADEIIELKTELLKKFMGIYPQASTKIEATGGGGVVTECIVSLYGAGSDKGRTAKMHVLLNQSPGKNKHEYKELYTTYGDVSISQQG